MKRPSVRRLKVTLAGLLGRLGLVRLVLHLRRRSPMVLRYHRVYPDGERPFYELGVSAAVFEAQMAFLRRHFQVVPLQDVFEGLFGSRPLPDHAVAITFDDGYRDNLTEATPVLQRHGLPATLFVSADNVEFRQAFWWDRLAAAVQTATAAEVAVDLGKGTERFAVDGAPARQVLFDRVREAVKLMPYDRFRGVLDQLEAALQPAGAATADCLLTWPEVETLKAGGWDLGSHSLDHPILSRVPPPEARRQVEESRVRIQSRAAVPVRYFSYPNGKRDDVTPEVKAEVRRAGYDGAVSTIEGRPGPRSDPFFLERKGVSLGMCTDEHGRFSEELFAAELSGIYDVLFLKKLRDRAIA
jgi:peptidoglycan/xylan/chitin deacetylase (PgdA/CDA1 family)